MASRAGDELTAAHRVRQQALRAATIRDLLILAAAWDGTVQSFGPVALALAALVELRRRVSAGLAAEYYRAFRVAEGAEGAATPRLAAAIEPARLRASLYVTGPGAVDRAVGAGRTLAKAREIALVNLAGSTSRHVLNAGRETVIASVAADKQARGWHRATAHSPCAFCAMLASRGPVYRSKERASFDAHDHCSCTAAPVFRGDGWTRQARAFRERWDAETAGLTGGEALNAFRNALTGA